MGRTLRTVGAISGVSSKAMSETPKQLTIKSGTAESNVDGDQAEQRLGDLVAAACLEVVAA